MESGKGSGGAKAESGGKAGVGEGEEVGGVKGGGIGVKGKTVCGACIDARASSAGGIIAADHITRCISGEFA